MEQFRKFLRGKGYALILTACLLAAAAAGVWAVRTVREELEKNLDGLHEPDAASRTEQGLDLTTPDEEDLTWQQQTAPAANSASDVPETASSAVRKDSDSSGSAAGSSSGSGSLHEPSALQSDSAPASSSAAPASTQPVSGRILNGYSGDELVYNKTLGDWRTHNGIDYAAGKGAEVRAPAAGRVTLAESDGSWGPVVAIEDGQGRTWRLCGVTAPRVKVGDSVTSGQTIGVVGSVSCECEEESHIHLEVKQGEHYLDPADLMH